MPQIMFNEYSRLTIYIDATALMYKKQSGN